MSNKLAITKAALESVTQPADIIELDAVKENWILSCMQTTGRTKEQAEIKFNLESLLFKKTVTSTKFDKATNMVSYYVALMELMLANVTLQEGGGYMVPLGDQCVFMVGWKGRLEQMQQIPRVLYVHQPEIVYEGDDFEYELAPVKRILRHKETPQRNWEVKTHVYMIVDMERGPVTYIMPMRDVFAIRNRRSKSYKDYVWKKDNGKWEDWMDLPMWISDENAAIKKTLVKHAYNAMPKTEKMKDLDRMQAERAKAHNIDPDAIDADEVAKEENVNYSDYTVVKEDGTENTVTFDKETGEVNPPANDKPPVANQEPKNGDAGKWDNGDF